MSTPLPGPAGPILPPTLAESLAAAVAGAPAVLAGWVRTARRGKRVAFLHLADGSQAAGVQCVLDPLDPELAALWPALSTGASVRVSGRWVACEGREQAWELAAERLHLWGAAEPATYPLQKKNHGLDFLRTIPHLRPRAKTFQAAFRIRHCLAQATHRFFSEQGFCQVHTPVLTAHDCEGGGQMFRVVGPQEGAGEGPFFGVPVHLTVSGQLNAEAMAYGLGRVYTFGPTFRAENSNTTRHLSEFWMVEPEAAFVTLAGNVALAVAYLKACLAAVLAEAPEQLTLLGERQAQDLAGQLRAMLDAPVTQLSYTEAVARIAEAGPERVAPVRWGEDLQAEHEHFLTDEVAHGPVVVIDWPRQLKAFYMFQNDDGRTVAAMDLLVPRIGELIGGSQREHRLERLRARLAEQGTEAASLGWYLDLHRYGAVPHSGFGLGFERLVMLCTGLTNVRDCIAFPRAPGQASD